MQNASASGAEGDVRRSAGHEWRADATPNWTGAAMSRPVCWSDRQIGGGRGRPTQECGSVEHSPTACVGGWPGAAPLTDRLWSPACVGVCYPPNRAKRARPGRDEGSWSGRIRLMQATVTAALLRVPPGLTPVEPSAYSVGGRMGRKHEIRAEIRDVTTIRARAGDHGHGQPHRHHHTHGQGQLGPGSAS